MGVLQPRHLSFLTANIMMPPALAVGVGRAIERVWSPERRLSVGDDEGEGSEGEREGSGGTGRGRGGTTHPWQALPRDRPKLAKRPRPRPPMPPISSLQRLSLPPFLPPSRPP